MGIGLHLTEQLYDLIVFPAGAFVSIEHGIIKVKSDNELTMLLILYE